MQSRPTFTHAILYNPLETSILMLDGDCPFLMPYLLTSCHNKYSVCIVQAIRAGTIDVSKDPYHFSLPPTWKQGKVANIQSGNFCQVQPISDKKSLPGAVGRCVWCFL